MRLSYSVRPTTLAKPIDTRNGTFTRQDINNLIHIPIDTIPPVTKIVVSAMLPCNDTGAVSRVALPVGATPSAITAVKTAATAVPPTVTGDHKKVLF